MFVQVVQQIVLNLQELHESAAQLISSLEECIEMSGEEGEKGVPQAGFIFEEIAEVSILHPKNIRYYCIAGTFRWFFLDHLVIRIVATNSSHGQYATIKTCSGHTMKIRPRKYSFKA